jgi:hypothetical protein
VAQLCGSVALLCCSVALLSGSVALLCGSVALPVQYLLIGYVFCSCNVWGLLTNVMQLITSSA